jgi:uncharacterized low-complexity protein
MNMSKQTIKPITLVAGAALAATLTAAPVHADVNPFGMSALASGYMVSDAKGTEGKCGGSKSVTEAECGANKAAAKAAEGECGANKKPAEGECGANKKPAAKPVQEAKCGEAKCGSNK